MAVPLPYPIPDPATGEWDPFALKRNLEFLAGRIDAATSLNQATVLFRVTGQPYSEVVSTAAETTIYSTTILGDVFDTFHSLRLSLQGDVLNDTGVDRSFTMRIKYGGTTLATLTLGPFVASATRRSWQIPPSFVSATGSTATQFALLQFGLQDPGVSGTSIAVDSAARSAHNALTVASSNAQTFAVTIQLSASDSAFSFRTMLVIGELV